MSEVDTPHSGAHFSAMLDSPEPPKSFLQKLQEKAAASRFFTVSLIIHMGIVILGGSVVLFKMSEPPVDFSAGEGLVSDTSAAPQEPETPPAPSSEPVAEAPSLTVPTLSAIATTAATPTFAVNMATASLPSLAAVSMAPSAAVPMGTGKMHGALRGRTGGKGAAAGAGATDAGEKAVMAGLRWLKQTQKSDGSWSSQHQAAMTGLAMLCFLGHGETSTSAEFGETVQKGINWILERGKAQNGVLTDNGRIDQPGSYTHGIVTYALGEYYAMTQDERAYEPFKQAIKLIVDGQGPDGGWMYGFDKSQSDTSVTGWQIQALKIAHLSGINIEGVDAAMDKAMNNLKRVQSANGAFGYRGPEDRWSLTGVGVLCTYFWKAERSESVLKGMKFIMSNLDKHPIEYKHKEADLYAWYYHTQAILMVSGKDGTEWRQWNSMFQNQLILNQTSDQSPNSGSWPVMAHGGHGNLQTDAAGAGPYYRTTLAILMLEVYYRYAAPNAKGGGALGGSLGGSSLDRPMGSALDAPKKPK
jgi:hypothetical protein